MMSDNVTAEWARKEANEILGEKVSKQLDQCETAIVSAVKRNEMSCNVTIYPHEKTIAELTKRGFKTKEHNGYDQRDPDYITISW